MQALLTCGEACTPASSRGRKKNGVLTREPSVGHVRPEQRQYVAGALSTVHVATCS